MKIYNDYGCVEDEAAVLFDETVAALQDLVDKLAAQMTYRDLYSFMADASHTAVCKLVCQRVVATECNISVEELRTKHKELGL